MYKKRICQVYQNQSGFSLIELMLVVGIFGILVAIGAPMVINDLPYWRMRSAARDLMGDFQTAKLEAVKRGANIAITFAPDVPPRNPPLDYLMFVDDGAGVPANAGNLTFEGDFAIGEMVLKEGRFHPDVVLNGVEFLQDAPGAGVGDNAVGYSSRGLPIVVAGVLRWGSAYFQAADMSHTSTFYRVVFSPVGGVSVERRWKEDGAGGNWQ